MIRRVWRVVVIAWALRTSWLAAAYVLGWAGVARHHVETASFILAGLLLIAGKWGPGKGGRESFFEDSDRLSSKNDSRPPFPGPHFPDLLVLLGLAFAVYWPALSIGLLSDDFFVLDRAAAWTLIDPAWEMVRPVPFAVWAAASQLLPEPWLPPALHVVNVGLHALNAWLVAWLMRRLGFGAAGARLAAAAFLLFPASVEAVAWTSGVFDVLLTTLALVAAGAALSAGRSSAGVMMAIALTAVALMTKETAIALPALIVMTAWMGSRLATRPPWMMAGASMLVVLAYVCWRVAGGTSLAAFPQLDGYAAKELLTRPFAALIVPFHQSFIARVPMAVALCAAAVPLIVACRLMLQARPSADVSRLVVGAALWVLAAATPVFTWFYVGPDLQGSRYVYLASAGWSMLLAVAVVPGPLAGPAWRSAGPRLAWLGIVVWLGFSAYAVRAHLAHWTDAARARDAALAAAALQDPSCTSPPAATPPGDLDGAYVFRNGFAEALRRECRRRLQER